jgi:Protein of unknown function (DUF2793)
MAVSYGPNLDQMINALTGDSFDEPFRLLLRTLDILVMPAVHMTSSAPPGSPANGDRYLVGTSPSGLWSGFTAGDLTVWTTDNPDFPGGVWSDYTPKTGWLVFQESDATFYYWSGTAWTAIGGGGSSTLAGLTDVAVSSPANGDVLTYNSGASKWENAAPSGGSSGPACQTRKKEGLVTASYSSTNPVNVGDGMTTFNASIYNSFTDPDSNGGGRVDYKQTSGTVDSAWGCFGEQQWRTGLHVELFAAIRFPGTADVNHFVSLVAGSSGQSNSFGNSNTHPSVQHASFRFSTQAGDSHWQCVTCDGSTETYIDSGITPDGNEHRFAIFFDDDNSQIKFFIDGALVGTSTTHLPAAGQNLCYYYSSRKHTTAPGSGDLLSMGQVIASADF